MRHLRLLPAILAAAAIACSEAPAPADYSDAVTADPDHYAMLFENDAVRVLRTTYGPGDESAMHEHPAHCAVGITDGTWTMSDPAGESMDIDVAAGELVCVDAVTHSGVYTGSEAAEAVLVEFKEGATAGSATSEYPAADVADPDHYTVESENDVARIIRIRYAPGETSTMHYHPANCAIFLGVQNATFELPDGEVVEPPPTEAGQVECTDAEAHLPTNAGEETLELVLVELKGRATFE